MMLGKSGVADDPFSPLVLVREHLQVRHLEPFQSKSVALCQLPELMWIVRTQSEILRMRERRITRGVVVPGVCYCARSVSSCVCECEVGVCVRVV